MKEEQTTSPPPAIKPLTKRQLGRAIHRLRVEREMTLADVSEKAFQTPGRTPYLSTIENGLYFPTFGNLEAIAGAFGLRAEELIARARSVEP